jgi:hypothetical protein
VQEALRRLGGDLGGVVCGSWGWGGRAGSDLGPAIALSFTLRHQCGSHASDRRPCGCRSLPPDWVGVLHEQPSGPGPLGTRCLSLRGTVGRRCHTSRVAVEALTGLARWEVGRPVNPGPRLLCSVVHQPVCSHGEGVLGQLGHGGILRFLKAAASSLSIVGRGGGSPAASPPAVSRVFKCEVLVP